MTDKRTDEELTHRYSLKLGALSAIGLGFAPDACLSGRAHAWLQQLVACQKHATPAGRPRRPAFGPAFGYDYDDEFQLPRVTLSTTFWPVYRWALFTKAELEWPLQLRWCVTRLLTI